MDLQTKTKELQSSLAIRETERISRIFEIFGQSAANERKDKRTQKLILSHRTACHFTDSCAIDVLNYLTKKQRFILNS